jgi:three-Cys-motif partner protein
MAKKSRTSKRLADNRSGNLFPDLPLPEERLDLVEVRGGIRPVWTEQKAKLIARYLKLFTFVTKHGTYIDGFAGRQSDDAVDGWAAELVLGNEPRWLRRFYLCDNGRPQLDALRELKNRQPAPKRKSESRIVEIIDGDFNKTVRDILDTRKLDRATFCLLDQRTFECKWATVEALAKYRTSPTKIELFYFGSSGSRVGDFRHFWMLIS